MVICASKISIARAKGTFTFLEWGTKRSPPFPFKCRRMITLSPSIAIAHWCSVVAAARHRLFREGQGRKSRATNAVALQLRRKTHLECADPNWFTTAAGVRDSVGNQTGRDNCYCGRNRWRCRNAARRFLRSHLFREGKEIADLVC